MVQINERPLQIDPTIASNSFLSVSYKLFNQLYINHDTKIIHIEYPNIHDSNPNQEDKICLPFKLPTKSRFSTFTEKDYPYISYIYTIKCKEPIHFKPRSGKTKHFPIKSYLYLPFELEDNTKFYPSNPYTDFLQKFKDVFHFLGMIVNDKNKDSCSTLIQNFTSHPATLPRGIIGYIEIPITQTTPPHYRVHDVNSLIHSVIDAYHPDTTIPIRQNDYTDMNFYVLEYPHSPH